MRQSWQKVVGIAVNRGVPGADWWIPRVKSRGGPGRDRREWRFEQDAAQAAFRSLRPAGERHERSSGGERDERHRKAAHRAPRERGQRSLPAKEPRALPPHSGRGEDHPRPEA